MAIKAVLKERTALKATLTDRSGKTRDLLAAHINDTNNPHKSLAFVVGPDEPVEGPALWFNIAASPANVNVMLLSLDEDETGAAMMAEVEGETYAVENAAVNAEPTKSKYNFEIV